jgi:ATP-dependent Clp protease ATP-binding subunit ClpC
MELFRDGKLNPAVFEADIRHGTHELNDVLAAALHTQSSTVESTHFLIALGKINGGVTQRSLNRLGLTVANWESGLARLTEKAADALPPSHLMRDALHPSAQEMLRLVESQCASAVGEISESTLLLCALRALPPPVVNSLKSAKIDRDEWCRELEKSLQPVEPIFPFSEDACQSLNMKAFTGAARKVLTLLKTEAESLGYSLMDPRHLCLALVERGKGVTQYAMFHQGIVPRRVQEAITISLRSAARRTPTSLSLDYGHLQPLLQRMLSIAGELAGRDHADRISEPHLLRGFLAVDSAARRVLEDEKVSINGLREIAETYDVTDEDEEDDVMADIQTVRDRLMRRLVGQDEAIEQILPYVELMRFGFTSPGRPIGTFLFCGQSGSGKTEMAKELARAIYGSEENLVFLEMAQFNSPESMNIFVGAPPGYIGYGEGKLTNGLRDKPRSVVLFDEVEKAHPKVLHALLRFLDEGKIDDPAGPVRDGSQCILILTSNVGAEGLSKLRIQLEKDPNRQAKIRKALRDEFKALEFRVEFLNRIEELILFRTLSEDDYTEIVRRLLQRDLDRLAKDHRIHVTDYRGVPEAIGQYCKAISEGARQAQRLVRKVVITPAIGFVVKNSLTPPVNLKVEAVRLALDAECEPSGVVRPGPPKAVEHVLPTNEQAKTRMHNVRK